MNQCGVVWCVGVCRNTLRRSVHLKQAKSDWNLQRRNAQRAHNLNHHSKEISRLVNDRHPSGAHTPKDAIISVNNLLRMWIGSNKGTICLNWQLRRARTIGAFVVRLPRILLCPAHRLRLPLLAYRHRNCLCLCPRLVKSEKKLSPILIRRFGGARTLFLVLHSFS